MVPRWSLVAFDLVSVIETTVAAAGMCVLLGVSGANLMYGTLFSAKGLAPFFVEGELLSPSWRLWYCALWYCCTMSCQDARGGVKDGWWGTVSDVSDILRFLVGEPSASSREISSKLTSSPETLWRFVRIALLLLGDMADRETSRAVVVIERGVAKRARPLSSCNREKKKKMRRAPQAGLLHLPSRV